MAELIPGNLLDLATQTVPTESDAELWSVTAGTRSWLGDGAYIIEDGLPGVIAATSAGTDETVTSMVSSVPVVPGEVYRGYAYAFPDGWPATMTVAIRWYDDTDTEVGTPAEVSWQADGSNAFMPITTGKAPSDAAAARLEMRCSHTAEGQHVYYDEMYLGAPPEVPGGLLSYDEYSVETTADDWDATGAELSRVRLSLSAGDAAYVLGITPQAEGTVEAFTRRTIPVVGGETYRVSALLASRTDTDPNATITCRTMIRWYDADGGFLGSGPDEPFYTPNVGSLFAAAIVQRTATAPKDAAYARPVLQILHTLNTTATTYYADVIYMESAEASYELEVSQRLAYVGLSINDVPPGVNENTTVSIWRYDESGSRYPVRGYGGDWVDTPFSGSGAIVVEDYEVPIGSRVFYRVVWDNLDDPYHSVSLTTRTVNAPRIADPSMVWIKSPGLPGLNRQVMMAENLSWKRAARSAAYPVVGRSRPVVISEVRSSREGQIKVRVGEVADHNALDALLSSGLPILLQVTPGYAGITDNLYLAVGDVEWEPESWNAAVPGWLWTMDVTEIERPAGGIQGSAGRTWQDIADSHATWREVSEQYGSWADVLTGG